MLKDGFGLWVIIMLTATATMFILHLVPRNILRTSPFSELRKAGVTLIKFEERDRMIEIHSTAGTVRLYWDYSVEVDGEITVRGCQAEKE